MSYLAAAVLALAAGPLLDAGAARRRPAPVLDGMVMAAVPGLVFLEFVPSAVGEGRWGVLVALVLAVFVAGTDTGSHGAGGCLSRLHVLAAESAPPFGAFPFSSCGRGAGMLP
ncbi:MAG: hypothetical protein OXU64_06245 [Gemmatimonadota bacterium]|nr:hypothetical protein [Gemmatimonadota bacterium]